MAKTEPPPTVDAYLAALPDDRRLAMEAVRRMMLDNLPEGYEEGIQYGMIGYYVPHSRFPQGYHCDPKQPLPFASIASQKNHMAIYLFCLYMQDEQSQQAFRDDWAQSGKKLDMGKGCIRFKKLDGLAMEPVAKVIRSATVDKFLAVYAQQDPREKKKARK